MLKIHLLNGKAHDTIVEVEEVDSTYPWSYTYCPPNSPPHKYPDGKMSLSLEHELYVPAGCTDDNGILCYRAAFTPNKAQEGKQ